MRAEERLRLSGIQIKVRSFQNVSVASMWSFTWPARVSHQGDGPTRRNARLERAGSWELLCLAKAWPDLRNHQPCSFLPRPLVTTAIGATNYSMKKARREMIFSPRFVLRGKEQQVKPKREESEQFTRVLESFWTRKAVRSQKC